MHKSLFLGEILHNIGEAREELERLEKEIARNKDDYSEEELGIGIAHAYHHLNWAWNIRHVLPEEYDVTDGQFKKWSQYPQDDMKRFEKR